MAIRLDALQAAARRTGMYKVASVNEARANSLRTIFLCHSHLDAALASGVQNMLQEAGAKVYVDWQDPAMPSVPNKTTADRIRQKIRSLDYFLFLATDNSTASRWCPWEIGYADGVKESDRVMVMPTEKAGTIYGNEYLALYRYIDLSDKNELAAWNAGETKNGKLVVSVFG